MKNNYFTHKSSYVDEGSQIGNGTKIWHFSHVMGSARIGKDCVLGQNVFIGPNVTLGNNVKIQNNVSVYEGVICEDDVFLGPSCVFTNVINPRSFIERKDEFQETKIGRGASIGANATIICGNNIGAYSIIGAGAVVTSNIPPHAIIVGNPGRKIGWACECGVTLNKDNDTYKCPECGKAYRINGEAVEEIK